MSLIPWRSFIDLEKFFDEDWFLPVLSSTELNKPAMDLYETEKEVVAEISVPDWDPEKIEVSIENGVLTVRGKMDEKKEEKKKGYWKKEIRKGSFERMIRLPVAVKEDATEATYEKGILRVVMPKLEEKSAPKVKVKVKSK